MTSQDSGRAVTILVAEDNDVNQMVVEQILETTGHSFTIVANGRQAANGLEHHGRMDAFPAFEHLPERCAGLRRELGGLHQAHARSHPVIACRVGGGGDHAAALVGGQRGELARAVVAQVRLVAPAAADDHRLPGQLGVAQQLDRRVEGVYVEVGDPVPYGGQGHGV